MKDYQMQTTYKMDHELDLAIAGLCACHVAADALVLFEDEGWTCTTIAIAWDRCAIFDGERELDQWEARRRLGDRQGELIAAVARVDRECDGLDEWARKLLADEASRWEEYV